MRLAKTTQSVIVAALVVGSVTNVDLDGMSNLIDDYFSAERPIRPDSKLLRAQLATYADELQTRVQNAWGSRSTRPSSKSRSPRSSSTSCCKG